MLTRLPSYLRSLLLLGAVVASGCRAAIPNRNPVGETFPTVAGESLDGTPLRLPADLLGAPAILLVGYVQDAQFDADRWLLGLAQSGTGARVFEVPTIQGWVPRMIAGTIDQGMRNGIPEEDWGSVVTVYADADAIAELTGTENPRNIRVVVLDSQGTVRWFHDRGYSAGTLLRLLDELPD
ncbi:MAG: hypothetical protein AAF682_12410 [Planctomycetota bacterium]